MKSALENESSKYHQEFGVLPTFKAGFHYGIVTAGELGTIKQDIAFSGDVLNTTARIQSLCNTYDVNILISGDLMTILKPQKDFQIKALGETELRGKNSTCRVIYHKKKRYYRIVFRGFLNSARNSSY